MQKEMKYASKEKALEIAGAIKGILNENEFKVSVEQFDDRVSIRATGGYFSQAVADDIRKEVEYHRHDVYITGNYKLEAEEDRLVFVMTIESVNYWEF